MENKENFYCLYPIHIDSSVSIKKGRKYSTENSVDKPLMKEIKSALDSNEIVYIQESDKRHPQDLREKGRFRIDKEFERKQTIKKIIDSIKELRQKKSLQSEGKAVNNFLNLKPKPKKKSKN